MRRRALVAWPADPAAEAEHVVAWLRVPAIALFAAGESLVTPNPHHVAFLSALVFFSAWTAAMLAWLQVRPVGRGLAFAATVVDVAGITALAVFSGGGFSHARLAYFLVPVSAAFRLRPRVTAAAAALTTTAYVVESFAQRTPKPSVRHVVVDAGFLTWVGLASVLLSFLFERRTTQVTRLAEQRARLLADALGAEQRERQALAESLHDHALQNLLSARHELQEAAEDGPHPALVRADGAVADTVAQLRRAVFELHPYVLDEAGLQVALRSIAQDAAARANLDLRLDLHYDRRHPEERVLFSAARELLANVVQHAQASHVSVRLAAVDGEVELVVEDDGCGFTPDTANEQLANGHIGLGSQRVRVETLGGAMEIASRLGTGTRVAIRLPEPVRA
jgi:two-component system NarL family sensor kinase